MPMFKATANKKGAKCALHHGAASIDVEAKQLYCTTCKVSLCTDFCFETFHTCQNLVRTKCSLKQKFIKDKQAKKQTQQKT